MSQDIPLLPMQFQDLIDRNGGFNHFRDLVLLENSRTFSGEYKRKIKQRMGTRLRNRRAA